MELSPELAARLALDDIRNNKPDVVAIPRSRKKIRLRFVKPYTLERITSELLRKETLEEEAKKGDGNALLRSAAKEPYYNTRLAALFVLNGYWKIKLFFPFLWRWWAYVRQWDEEQVGTILQAAQKKTLDLSTRLWINTKSAAAMRTDLMIMTKGEVEQYLQGLGSDEKRPSSRTSQATEQHASA